MVKHEEKDCPRCQAVFTCKTGDILRCQCYGIKLTLEETAFIEERYPDCLCRHCLEELKQKYAFFMEKFMFRGGR